MFKFSLYTEWVREYLINVNQIEYISFYEKNRELEIALKSGKVFLIKEGELTNESVFDCYMRLKKVSNKRNIFNLLNFNYE